MRHNIENKIFGLFGLLLAVLMPDVITEMIKNHICFPTKKNYISHHLLNILRWIDKNIYVKSCILKWDCISKSCVWLFGSGSFWEVFQLRDSLGYKVVEVLCGVTRPAMLVLQEGVHRPRFCASDSGIQAVRFYWTIGDSKLCILQFWMTVLDTSTLLSFGACIITDGLVKVWSAYRVCIALLLVSCLIVATITELF